MKHRLAFLGLFLLPACRSAGDQGSPTESNRAPARPEIRYYEIADA